MKRKPKSSLRNHPSPHIWRKTYFADINGATILPEVSIPNESESNLGLAIRLSSPCWHGIFQSQQNDTRSRVGWKYDPCGFICLDYIFIHDLIPKLYMES